MTTETVTTTPMDDAMDPQQLPADRTYFGDVTTVDAWFCVLQKGQGKVQFDALQHAPYQRRTAIDIGITPLKGSYTVEQKTIATADDWLKVTLPSLREHGVTLTTLKGRFCQVHRVPTGETYINKNGVTKEKSALQFVAFYDDLEACAAASEAWWIEYKAAGHAGVVEDAELPADVPQVAQAATNGAEKPTVPDVVQIRRLWTASQKDAVEFAKLLKISALGQRFTIDSPEVWDVISPADGDGNSAGLPF